MTTRILDALLAFLCAAAICALGFSWGYYSQSTFADVALADPTGEICTSLDEAFEARLQGAECVVTGYVGPDRKLGWSINTRENREGTRFDFAETAVVRMVELSRARHD